MNPGVVLWIIKQTHRVEFMAFRSFMFAVQFIGYVYAFWLDQEGLECGED